MTATLKFSLLCLVLALAMFCAFTWLQSRLESTPLNNAQRVRDAIHRNLIDEAIQ